MEYRFLYNNQDLRLGNELTPSQLRNLEDSLEREIIDKTMLILEILTKRAKTREAKLQVEVARLKFMLLRLEGLNDNLSRQVVLVSEIKAPEK